MAYSEGNEVNRPERERESNEVSANVNIIEYISNSFCLLGAKFKVSAGGVRVVHYRWGGSRWGDHAWRPGPPASRPASSLQCIAMSNKVSLLHAGLNLHTS